ncbi:MAG: secondary thiamine-phosphate synthase enzyme YjbQ [Thermodesulfobacteriota bacterium]|nr:secondary thiamine-phosphate synthase enzyme YjbQ [Thermodesulfobacteriota bacterium]
MKIFNTGIYANTTGDTDIIDITHDVSEKVLQSNMSNGNITVFVSGSTAAVTTIEFESGVIHDLMMAIERIAPRDIHYEHDRRWGDGNGYSHVRAALLGASLTIPLMEKRPMLGTWQQIVLLDFDNRPRRREVKIQIIGE